MNIEDESIKTAYEEEGMSPSEIAVDRNLNEIAVKAKLMSISVKYRKASNCEPDDVSGLNFSDDQLATVNNIIFETAIAATTPDGQIDWRARLDAAKYIRDDKKGRKEVQKQLNGNTFNILALNETLSNAREGAKKMRELVDV